MKIVNIAIIIIITIIVIISTIIRIIKNAGWKILLGQHEARTAC